MKLVRSDWTTSQLRSVAAYPHLIGHMVGKNLLTPMHSQWCRDLWLPRAHTGLEAHRGARKSTICVEVGVVWWLLFHPSDRIAIIRETQIAAIDALHTIALYLQDELIQSLFFAVHGRYPRALVDRAGRLTFSFKGTITKEGSVDAYGVETVPTGSHYDVILCDDICTIRDRFSKAKRERTKAYLQELITNILDPDCYLRLVGTPWHKDDIWSLEGIPIPSRYDVYQTGIFTPEQIAAKRRTTTAAMWALNYELRYMTDVDVMFKDPTFGPWEAWRLRDVQAHVDARFDGDHYTALTIMGRRSDDRLQVWQRVWDAHVRDCVDAILAECETRGAHTLHIETNPDKGWSAGLISAGGSGKHRIPIVESYHEDMNKQRKIETYVGEAWHRLVLSDDYEEVALAMLCEYRGDEPDDGPDSLASLIRRAYPLASARRSPLNSL